MLGLVGVMEVCEEELSGCQGRCLKSNQNWCVGDDDKKCGLRPVWVSVLVSGFVSETSSVSLLDAVSVDENRPLDDTLSVVDPSPSPPPCPSIKPSPPLSSDVRPSASTSTAGGWSEGDSGWSCTTGG